MITSYDKEVVLAMVSLAQEAHAKEYSLFTLVEMCRVGYDVGIMRDKDGAKVIIGEYQAFCQWHEVPEAICELALRNMAGTSEETIDVP